MNKKVQAIYYSWSFGFLAIKLTLAVTTFLAGFALGVRMFADVWEPLAWGGGIVVGFLMTKYLDGVLDNCYTYLLTEGFDIWYAAAIFVLSIATGGTTWFSASIIADAFSDNITPTEKASMLTERQDKNDSRIIGLNNSIAAKIATMAVTDSLFEIERELLLSKFNHNHRKMIEQNRHLHYYGRPTHTALTASVDQYNTLDSAYQANIAAIQSDIATLSGALVRAQGKDVSGLVAAEVMAHNARSDKKETEVTAFVRYLDYGCVVGGWLIFGLIFRLRKKHPNETFFNVDVKSGTVWLSDTLGKLQNAAMLTDTKVDDRFFEAVRALLNIIGGVFEVLTFIMNLIYKILISPTKIKLDYSFLITHITKGVFRGVSTLITNRSNRQEGNTQNSTAQTAQNSTAQTAQNRQTQTPQANRYFFRQTPEDETPQTPTDETIQTGGEETPQTLEDETIQTADDQTPETPTHQTPPEPVQTGETGVSGGRMETSQTPPRNTREEHRETILKTTSVHTVEHNGKEVDLAYCNNMVKHYEKMMREIEGMEAKPNRTEKDIKRDKNTRANRERNLEYWSEFVTLLEFQKKA